MLEGDRTDEVPKLKQELNGKIVTYDSNQLACPLIEYNLIVEMRPIVFSVVLWD